MVETEDQLWASAEAFHASAAVEQTESPKKLDLAKVEQDLFDFFNKLTGKIPDWVPVVPAYLNAKKAQWEANAALRSKNLATGEKIENKPEALKLFLEKTFKSMWAEGTAVIDLLLIFGTGGSGNVAVGVERMAVKQAGKAAGKAVSAEGIAAGIARLAKGGEGAAIDMFPGLFKGLGEKLAHHPEQAKHLFELSKVFEKLLAIPGARPILQELLANQEWWQKLKKELESSAGRVAHGENIMRLVQKTGFTLTPNPA